MAKRPKTIESLRKRGPAEISISTPAGGVGVSTARLRRLIEFVASAEGRKIAAVDLAVVSSARMARLHRRWRGAAGGTDVLSFDLSEPGSGCICAQIVVSAGAAARQGPRHGHSRAKELMLYVIHGLLHLTGYDDTTPAAAAKMLARQDHLLAAFARPQRRRCTGAEGRRAGH